MLVEEKFNQKGNREKKRTWDKNKAEKVENEVIKGKCGELETIQGIIWKTGES